jgi:flagellar assembly protein FliH
MSALRKYTFELEFDENGEIVRPEEEEEALEEVEDLPPPEPTFTKAELEAAREEGYTAGRDEMRAEAEASTETSAMLALNALAEHFAGISEAQDAAIEEIRRESVAIACAVTRKMFPSLAQQVALPEIETVIQNCLREYITEPRIFVRVHEDVREMVKEKTEAIVEQTGFRGDLIVVAEPGLGRSDCVLEWGAGGAERRTEWLWQNIDREVADALGVPVEQLEAFPWSPAADTAAAEEAAADTTADAAASKNAAETGAAITEADAEADADITEISVADTAGDLDDTGAGDGNTGETIEGETQTMDAPEVDSLSDTDSLSDNAGPMDGEPETDIPEMGDTETDDTEIEILPPEDPDNPQT